MTFLPIVQRELRTAARRRNTFRVRWWAALLGLGLMMLSLMMMSFSRRGNIGNPLFNLLTGYAFGVSLLAGVFLTADALTEEKKSGTLGLLFLTNLKGYDVVLGKFMAHWLNAFYCLLALLPITALPILLGGVEGAEFWRMALALANALFFSLAAGICVSAFMRDTQRAMGNTLGLVLLVTVFLPLFGKVGTVAKVPAAWLNLALVSPFYPYSYASEMLYARHAGAYWGSLAASQLMAWCFLGAASRVLPRVLKERGKAGQTRTARRRQEDPAKRARRRARVLGQNPVQWLRSDELGIPWLAWLVAIGWLITAVLMTLFGGNEFPMMLGYMSTPFAFLLKVLFAVQACRFFAEARGNGALELLLCTPLTDRQVIGGQMKALWLAFTGPLAVFVGGLFVPAFLKIGTLLVAQQPAHQYEPMLGILGGSMLSAAYLLRLAADLFAILWLGTALALTGKKPRLAPALTILFVLLLPSPLSFCWLDVLVDLIFISWGTSKCRQNLRQLIAQQYLPR